MKFRKGQKVKIVINLSSQNFGKEFVIIVKKLQGKVCTILFAGEIHVNNGKKERTYFLTEDANVWFFESELRAIFLEMAEFVK